MNWTVLFIAFALAVIMGRAFGAFLLRKRPEWSARRRLLVAAAWLPAVLILLTLGGLAVIVASGPGSGENMTDLAFAATGTIGSLFALIAFVGGLIGAALAQRGGDA